MKFWKAFHYFVRLLYLRVQRIHLNYLGNWTGKCRVNTVIVCTYFKPCIKRLIKNIFWISNYLLVIGWQLLPDIWVELLSVIRTYWIFNNKHWTKKKFRKKWYSMRFNYKIIARKHCCIVYDTKSAREISQTTTKYMK